MTNYNALEHMGRRNRPPPQLDLSDNVLLGHETPVTAVGTVVPVVTHHEVVTLGYDGRSEVVVAAELRRHEPVVHRLVVGVYAAVNDADGVASSAITRLTNDLSGLSG